MYPGYCVHKFKFKFEFKFEFNFFSALSAWVDAYHGFDAKPKCTLDPLPPLATPLMT
eukprot:SAG11_NODE_1809_length_4224_cov_5.960000_1_plen_56_part_10